MIRNYIKIAWRNLFKNKVISAINIFGLSAGIAFALLIAGYVWNELQVNKHLKNADNQYILQSKWKDPNMGLEFTTLGPLAKALKEQYPNLVANYYRFDAITSNVSKGDKTFRENIQLSDSTMLTMYGFDLLHGNERTALNDPFTMVITAEKAIKYFGKTDIVGQTLLIENFSGTKHEFMITGVMAKPHENSVTHFNDDNDNQFNISNSSLNFFGRNIDVWANRYAIGYLELKNGVTPADIEQPMIRLIKENTDLQTSTDLKPVLVPLKTYYLDANNGLIKKMLYTLSGIALFILIMAVVNFINISIGKSASRMKEIGLRKVLGSLHKELIYQFLTESVLLVFFATLLALAIYQLSKNYFSTMLGREIPDLFAYPGYFLAIPFIIVLFVGILAGIYPAFFLSSLKSIDSLKGKLQVKENVLLRRVLIGFQFCTAVMVFAGALIISKQINLFFSEDLGYDKEYIVGAQVPRDWTQQGARSMGTKRNEFAAMPQVKAASLSYEIPNGNNGGNSMLYKPSSDSTQAISAQVLVADENYAKTYGITLASGTFFHPGGNSDSLNVVINETQAKAFGWENQEAIGKQLKVQGQPTTFTVAGVTTDFHFGSMQQVIQPVTFFHVRYMPLYRYFSFKLKPGNIENSLADLQKKWSDLLPGSPFEYTFINDTLERLYKTELQLKKASYTASALSLIIVSLGILGLISLNVQKRTKEIGIRKVLGSSVTAIVLLFMKEFLLIMLLAGLVAGPLAYMMMQDWLNDYAYRIPLTAQPFILSIFILAVLTTVVIILQTVKAAMANPVKSLRTE